MSGYIMSLRKVVGHRPLLQVGASTVVRDELGRILLQKRTDNGCWGYAGGSVELDEDVESAARRELFEETGLVAQEMRLVGVFSGPDLHYIYPNGDEVSNVDILFECTKWTGDLVMQEDETADLRFFYPDEVPENLSPPIVRPLKTYLEELKNR